MTAFVCPNCGKQIQFLTGVAICLNPDCKLGHTLTPNEPEDINEQPPIEVDPDRDHPDQSPIRRDEDDSGGG